MSYELDSLEAIRLVQRAIRDQWDIPPDVFRELPVDTYKQWKQETDPAMKLALSRLMVTLASENRAAATMAINAMKGTEPVISVNVPVVNHVNLEPKTAMVDRDMIANVLTGMMETGLFSSGDQDEKD